MSTQVRKSALNAFEISDALEESADEGGNRRDSSADLTHHGNVGSCHDGTSGGDHAGTWENTDEKRGTGKIRSVKNDTCD